MKLFKPKRMTWIFIVSAATAILALVSGYLQYKEKIESGQKNLKKEEELKEVYKKLSEKSNAIITLQEENKDSTIELHKRLEAAKDTINKLNSQIIEELKGGDLPFSDVGFDTDSTGKFFYIHTVNFTDLPIYSIGIDCSDLIFYEQDFVELNEMKMNKRVERNVLQPKNNWYCLKTYIEGEEKPLINIVFAVNWRLDRYLCMAKFEKDTNGYYAHKSTNYYYKKALYSTDEFQKLVGSKEKIYKAPLANH